MVKRPLPLYLLFLKLPGLKRAWYALLIRALYRKHLNRKTHLLRKRRIREKRAWLIEQLGGPSCTAPTCPGGRECGKPSIDHMDGRSELWRKPLRSYGQEERIDIMIAEFKAGVRLRVVGEHCNARLSDHYNHRDEEDVMADEQLPPQAVDDVPF